MVRGLLEQSFEELKQHLLPLQKEEFGPKLCGPYLAKVAEIL